MMLKKILAHALAFALGVPVLLSSVPASAQPSQVGQWTTLTQLPFFPVHDHLLPTGQVLIWPGDAGISGNDPRLWDPATQAVTTLPKPGYDLFCTGHAFLADGRLFVAGGHIQNNVGLPKASIYDPFANTWTATPDMNAGRWYPTVTALANGDALVVSGDIDLSVGVNTLPQVYQTGTRTWRSLTSAQLSQDLYPMMFLAPNGKVINVAPTPTTRYLDTSGTGSWSVLANRNFGDRNYGSAVMYADGKILVLGGGDPPTSTAEVIDLNQPSPSWRTVASMSVARRQLNATLLPDGNVLVTGGTSGPGFNNATTPVYTAELWNPATETWKTLASATVPRLYHSAAVLLPDGRVLSTGGNDYPTPEAYSPPYLFNGARPAMSGVPPTMGYGQTFSVQSPDAASIAKVTLIRITSVTHAFNENQRLSVLSFTPGSGTLDIVSPANANIAPPGHYLLFIVTASGVPSIGSIVRLDASAPPPPPPPPPAAATITSLSPNSVVAGGPAFTLTVNGSGFVSGATVRWNGADRTTTFVSGTQLRAAISGADIATPGTFQVTAVNPGAATSNALPFTVSAATTTFTLTVSKNGSDSSKGTVTSSPAGINCGTTCSSAFNSGTVVTLTARVVGNRAFTGWSGACTGTGTCTVTMDGPKAVTATFSRR
ncbi:MAG TPA: galactose oxidase-like domain-containing protein [Burkholderiaceae bacterium]